SHVPQLGRADSAFHASDRRDCRLFCCLIRLAHYEMRILFEACCDKRSERLYSLRFPKIWWHDHRPRRRRGRTRGFIPMANTLLMPKATAVWLVDNTSLSFDQIAQF